MSTSVIPAPMTPNRKRKRNLSSVNLVDIPSSELQGPADSASTIPAPRPLTARGVFTNIFSDELPSSSADTKSIDSRDTSPIFDRVLQYDNLSVGSNSPRSNVARRLSHLQIERADSESDADVQSIIDDIDEATGPSTENRPEPDSPSRSNKTRATLQRQNSGPPPKRVPPPRGIKSPPPKNSKSPPSKSPITQDSISSETDKIIDSWLELSALTWQDSEITGHLMLDSDDDGYGINGIGFKPTPAMALARSRRRKQQVSAWKTREEREERERRAEKRRKGKTVMRHDDFGGSMPTFKLPEMRDTLDKKIVRFSV